MVGFDVDLLDLLAKDLGLKQDVVNIEWAQVTSGAAFKAKKCDVGMGAMTITDGAAGRDQHHRPVHGRHPGAAGQEGRRPTRRLADLKGKKVGVQADTTGKDYADERPRRIGYQVIPFNDLALQVNNVKSGRVDAGDQRQRRALRLRQGQPGHDRGHRVRHRRAVRLRRAEGRQRPEADRRSSTRCWPRPRPTASTTRSTRSGSGLSRRSERARRHQSYRKGLSPRQRAQRSRLIQYAVLVVLVLVAAFAADWGQIGSRVLQAGARQVDVRGRPADRRLSRPWSTRPARSSSAWPAAPCWR